MSCVTWFVVIGFSSFMFGAFVCSLFQSVKINDIMRGYKAKCDECREKYKRRKRDGIIEGMGV